MPRHAVAPVGLNLTVQVGALPNALKNVLATSEARLPICVCWLNTNKDATYTAGHKRHCREIGYQLGGALTKFHARRRSHRPLYFLTIAHLASKCKTSGAGLLGLTWPRHGAILLVKYLLHLKEGC